MSTAAKLSDTLEKPLESRKVHFRGKYVIRTSWSGKTLLYDVWSRTGAPVSSGLDMLNLDEETALEGIVNRLYGKGRPAHA